MPHAPSPLLPPARIVQSIGVNGVQIQPAVPVKVEPTKNAAHQGHRVSRHIPTKGSMPKVQPDLFGDIVKLNQLRGFLRRRSRSGSVRATAS
jgi:hypothetical protein